MTLMADWSLFTRAASALRLEAEGIKDLNIPLTYDGLIKHAETIEAAVSAHDEKETVSGA